MRLIDVILASLLLACLACLGALLYRTDGLREVVEPTLPGRAASDARATALEGGVRALRGDLAVVTRALDAGSARVADLERRAAALEALIDALRKAHQQQEEGR